MEQNHLFDIKSSKDTKNKKKKKFFNFQRSASIISK